MGEDENRAKSFSNILSPKPVEILIILNDGSEFTLNEEELYVFEKYFRGFWLKKWLEMKMEPRG